MVEVAKRRTYTAEHPPGYVNGRMFSDADHLTVLRTDFDVESYQSEAKGYLDIDEFGNAPAQLDPLVARDLAFVWRLESNALAETRAMLSSWTANEARITAFIATWAFERYWMARASRDLLEQAGAPTGAVRRPHLTGRIRDTYVERVLPLVAPVLGGTVKEPVTAGHMSRMAVQEGAINAAQTTLLNRLTGKSRAVLETVIARRATMVEFFQTEATTRISRSRTEAISATLHLVAPWAPLRSVGVPDPDEEIALTSIFGSTDSWVSLVESDLAVGSLLPSRPLPGVAQVRRAFARRQQRARNSRLHVRRHTGSERGNDNDGL